MRRSSSRGALALCLSIASVSWSLGCGPLPWSAQVERDAGAAPWAQSVDKQLLFGDLHVHTTYSWDAFLFSLPISGGEGAHPPDDACDFARYCAGLDFYALTDHAESLSVEDWEASKESVRRCNERAGDAASPDLAAFMGFEWSQAGNTPEDHWGHRCVVFPGTGDADLPARPIGSGDKSAMQTGLGRGMRAAGEAAFADYLDGLAERPLCAEGVDTRRLPPECIEKAETPAVLNEKLRQWGMPALVIPHGTAWGIYTPATTSIAKHLTPANFDPELQKLVEIESGHGNSEEYRSWREFDVGPMGEKVCLPPEDDYLPCCWQAGEIARDLCAEPDSAACDADVERARREAMDRYGIGLSRMFPDVDSTAWLDCGQCRDCFRPAFSHRPLESVQYAMALSNSAVLGDDGRPLRFRYGFIGSSDGHSARPGTGYKQIERLGMMTDANAPPSNPEQRELRDAALGPIDQRVQNFLYPGGLVAVHASGRSREAIWDALNRREVYGTSGPRIRLWFDLVNADEGLLPMGSAVALDRNPVFEVRAQGSFEQQPGCPKRSASGLAADRMLRLCRDECYHPSDVRRPIERIEVVRIWPQLDRAERVDALIEDPWRVFECDGDPAGCTVRFEDKGFLAGGRDALYYVRALEVASPAINGDPLQTRFDAMGNAVSVTTCGTSEGDDPNCLAPVQERAWSSPIFVDSAAWGERLAAAR